MDNCIINLTLTSYVTYVVAISLYVLNFYIYITDSIRKWMSRDKC